MDRLYPVLIQRFYDKLYPVLGDNGISDLRETVQPLDDESAEGVIILGLKDPAGRLSHLNS